MFLKTIKIIIVELILNEIDFIINKNELFK